MTFTSPTPLVSVVIPAYNYARYVGEAIDSVLAQTYSPVEIIVIDDGSTDDTADVLTAYSTRVTVVRQTNAGHARTLNRGWQQAKGEILSYLNADDRLLPTAVSAAVASLRAHADAVMVYGDYALIDPRSLPIRRVHAPDFDYQEMVRKLVCPPGPGVFIRREAAKRAGEWDTDFPRGLDFELWLRLALIGPFVRIPEVLAEFRVHERSTTFAVADPWGAEEPVRIMQKYFGRADLPSAIRVAESEALSSAYLLAARSHLRAQRLRAAASAIARAARLHPANLIRLYTFRLLVNALLNRPAHLVMWALRRRRDRS